MHELGMSESILDAVMRRAAGRRVVRVRLQVGVLHRVHEPSLEQSFSLVAEGTDAAGAALEMTSMPVRARCEACAWTSDCEGLVAVCQRCGSTEVVTSGGDELVLESIELSRTEEGPCALEYPARS